MCINLETKRLEIKDIQNNVVPKCAHKWRELGIQLNVDQHQLDIVEKDHPNDCKGCCTKIFSIWLDSNSAACWEDIDTAVDEVLNAGM